LREVCPTRRRQGEGIAIVGITIILTVEMGIIEEIIIGILTIGIVSHCRATIIPVMLFYLLGKAIDRQA
jgi:hypothetical protein